MVVAADQLASNAGVAMLDQGGSGADAAVAAAAVMAVVGPHLCGMGGDMLAMVSGPGQAPEALLAVGRAGSGVDAARLRAEGHAVMPLRGDARTVPVPAAVDGWLALHGRYGRLTLEAVLAPAISLAEDGFAASLLLSFASHLVAGFPGTDELCPDGPLQPGDRVRLPGVARTLRAIAAGGRDAFYGGEFGRALLEVGDGVFAEADLAGDLAVWDAPLHLRAWGSELWTVPPPSQGYLTLAGVRIAEQAGMGTDPVDPVWAHLGVEAATAAGFDRPAVLFDGADGDSLLDVNRLAERARWIRPDHTVFVDVEPGDMAPPRPPARPRGRGHHAPLRHRRGRLGRLPHPVERPRLRLPPGGRHHRRLPAQPWRRLLLGGGSPGRTGSAEKAAAHPLAHAGHRSRKGGSPTWSVPWAATRSRRSSCSCRPGCCTAARTRPPRWPPPASPSRPRLPVRSASGGESAR